MIDLNGDGKISATKELMAHTREHWKVVSVAKPDTAKIAIFAVSGLVVTFDDCSVYSAEQLQ